MNDKLIEIEIITPEKIVISKKAKSVTVPGEKGSFQVLFNHASLLSNLSIGSVKIHNEDDSEEYLSTSGGFVSVEKNKVQILAETVERAVDIDLKRADNSKARAEDRLHSKDKNINFERAELALERAKNRLKVGARLNQP